MLTLILWPLCNSLLIHESLYFERGSNVGYTYGNTEYTVSRLLLIHNNDEHKWWRERNQPDLTNLPNLNVHTPDQMLLKRNPCQKLLTALPSWICHICVSSSLPSLTGWIFYGVLHSPPLPSLIGLISCIARIAHSSLMFFFCAGRDVYCTWGHQFSLLQDNWISPPPSGIHKFVSIADPLIYDRREEQSDSKQYLCFLCWHWFHHWQ